MIGRANTFLGLAVADRAIACAEVTANRAGPRGAGTARRTATFAFPAELSFDQPQELGAALAMFLREQKFLASRVVVGVPARWLIAVERDVPPADETAARAMLRLQAERLAVAESGEVVFDFVGKPDPSTATKVLLVGMLRKRLEHVEQMTDAAGLSLSAVTSTGLALASCAGDGNQDGGVLMLSRGGGEIVWRHNLAPRMLRHVSIPAANGHGPVAMSPLTAELRRAVTLAQTNGGGRDLLLLDGIGLEPNQVAELSERLGVQLRSGRNTDVCGIESHTRVADAAHEREAPARFAPAMSLALTGARPALLPMDFKHARLAPEKLSRFGRRSSWGMILGALALVGVVALYVMAHQRQNQLDELDTQLKKLQPDIAAAQATVDRFKYARGFFAESRPPLLDCLRELSLAFNEGDRAWIGALVLPANGKGTITGRAADASVVLAVVERIKKNPRFTDVKGPDTREADPKSREVSFTVSFSFTATPEGATSS